MDAVKDSFPEMWEGIDYEAYQEKVAFINNFMPPIVTKEELNWRGASDKRGETNSFAELLSEWKAAPY